MNIDLWQHCLDRLKNEIPNQQFNTWIRPLHCVQVDDRLRLMAPNAFVLDWVKKHYLDLLKGYLSDLGLGESTAISLEIGSAPRTPGSQAKQTSPGASNHNEPVHSSREPPRPLVDANTNPDFNFESFVEGKSNQLARAAGMQIGDNPGRVYNPLFI